MGFVIFGADKAGHPGIGKEVSCRKHERLAGLVPYKSSSAPQLAADVNFDTGLSNRTKQILFQFSRPDPVIFPGEKEKNHQEVAGTMHEKTVGNES
jgi:hypothetical protein